VGLTIGLIFETLRQELRWIVLRFLDELRDGGLDHAMDAARAMEPSTGDCLELGPVALHQRGQKRRAQRRVGEREEALHEVVLLREGAAPP
jgi:hypothetical protein